MDAWHNNTPVFASGSDDHAAIDALHDLEGRRGCIQLDVTLAAGTVEMPSGRWVFWQSSELMDLAQPNAGVELTSPIGDDLGEVSCPGGMRLRIGNLDVGNGAAIFVATRQHQASVK